MKNAIETLLNAYVSDNAAYIKETGGNVAEYILAVAEAMENGWYFFLSEDEILEVETRFTKLNEFINQITAYVNEHYNYNLKNYDKEKD